MVEETGTSNIKVMCRFRPVNEKEKQVFPDLMCVEFLNDNQSVIVNQQSEHNDALQFKFDYVFPPEGPQEAVYNIAAKPIVEAVMQGFNGTIFAYGQTSSGKTYTMMGSVEEEGMGIIPRMVSTVFEKIKWAHAKIEFQVKLAYCEIYMEKIRDLLEPSKTNLKIHEEKTRGVYIADLTEQYVTCESEVFELMSIGNENREVGYTQMNAGSSRSHSIFSLTITQTNLLDYSAKTGKMYLVDLAGSEKVSKTGAAGKRLEEAKNINKSLTMLGLVIAALTDPKSGHIPYRDSKLTRILQDSLGGNSKTNLIITCSPSPYNESETISTCRFGIRAKSIKNKPKVNREYTIAELKLMLSKAREEISRKNRIILALEKALGRSASTLPSIKDQVDDDEDKESELNDTKINGAYDDVITELEDARNKLEEEVAKNNAHKMTIENINTENKELLNGYEFINKQIEKLQEKLLQADELVRDKEDCVERLTVANEALKSELSGENSKKLNLEIVFLRNELQNTKKELEASNQATEEENQRLILDLQEEKVKNSKLLLDMETMEENLQKLIKENSKVIDQEALQILQDTHAALKNQWQTEKRTLMRELNLRIDKNIESEKKLKNSNEKYANLEKNLSEGERASKDRSDTLERNLEQLTLMYHQLVGRESNLKVEKKVCDTKINRLTNKISNLEKEAKERKQELDRLQYDNKKNLAELAELREFKSLQIQDSLLSPTPSQKRTIRGGHLEPSRKTVSFYPSAQFLESLKKENDVFNEI